MHSTSASHCAFIASAWRGWPFNQRLLGHCKLMSCVSAQWEAAAIRSRLGCRIRKHHCKHIRLVLTQLDIGNCPGDWQQVGHRFAVCPTWRREAIQIFLVRFQAWSLTEMPTNMPFAIPDQSQHVILSMQAVEKKLDEAQSDVLDEPLSKRAKGAQRKHPAGLPKEQHAGDGALAAKFL